MRLARMVLGVAVYTASAALAFVGVMGFVLMGPFADPSGDTGSALFACACAYGLAWVADWLWPQALPKPAWVDTRPACEDCHRAFGDEMALRQHRHAKHGVRGRITPKRLWSDG